MPPKKRKAEPKNEEEEKPSKRVSSRLASQTEKKEKQESEIGSWKEEGVGLVWCSSGDKNSTKESKIVYGFDMDDTLIHTKSGKTFAVSRTDWVWWNNSVPEKLKELNSQGIRVVIFTNQAGINGKNGYDTAKANQIKGKIQDLSAELGFPLEAYVATSDDQWRKPSTSMWDFMVKNSSSSLDLKRCLYVGDAAGRAANWKPGKKKDFSCSDRKFAYNIGIEFKTPEEFFLKEAAVKFEWGSFLPKEYKVPSEITEGGVSKLTSNKQELILLHGFPGSGKSTLVKKYMEPKGYVHVNRDTLKTQAKCLSAASDALENGKSVVIDNTNPSKKVREEYINLAKEFKVSQIRCFVMNVDEMLAQHLNYFRERLGVSDHVSKIGYNVFKKNKQDPELSEGFTEIRNINFIPDLDSFGNDQKQLFYQLQ